MALDRAAEDADDEESLRVLLQALGFDCESSLRKLQWLNVWSIQALAAQSEERLLQVSGISLA